MTPVAQAIASVSARLPVIVSSDRNIVPASTGLACFNVSRNPDIALAGVVPKSPVAGDAALAAVAAIRAAVSAEFDELTARSVTGKAP